MAQGCGLAQVTVAIRLLFWAVIFKKFHPCCILAHCEALVCHQPWGSFCLQRVAVWQQAKVLPRASPGHVPHPGKAV